MDDFPGLVYMNVFFWLVTVVLQSKLTCDSWFCLAGLLWLIWFGYLAILTEPRRRLIDRFGLNCLVWLVGCGKPTLWSSSESIEWFIEDQAFLQVVSFSQSSCVSPVELTDGRGGGRGTKSYDLEKAWPSINYSILSDQAPRLSGYAKDSLVWLIWFGRLGLVNSPCCPTPWQRLSVPE